MFKELCCQIVITPYLTSRVDKTNHGLVTAPFFVQILKCLLQFLELSRRCLCNQPLLLLLRYAGAIQFISSDLLNCLRSICTIVTTTIIAKKTLKSSPLIKFSLKAVIFHSLNVVPVQPPQKFMLKHKNQQYDLCFQTIFPFFITIVL